MSYSNEPLLRAETVYRSMVSLFGNDAVTRKFGAGPPPEWQVAMRPIKDYELIRGVRRMTNSGKAHVPSLPEFLRYCREVQSDEFPDENRKGLIALPSPQQQMDGWDVLANDHLMSHIKRQAGNRKYYCTAQMTRAEIIADFTRKDEKGALVNGAGKVDPASWQLTQPLVEAKNIWAAEMREMHAAGTLPKDHGRKMWDEAMANADSAVEYYRKNIDPEGVRE